MKIKPLLLKFYFFLLALLLLPFEVSAQTGCVGSCVSQGLTGLGLSGVFGSTGLASTDTLSGLIIAIINIMLLIAGAIAVGFIIVGGYQYITSAGNEELAEKGKKSLVNAIIGVVVIVMAYAIVQVIVNTVISPSGLI